MPPVDRDTRFSENRLGFLQWGIIGAFLLLVSGFWRLQILQPDYYNRLAEQNYIKNLPIAAPRGPDLDRDGRVIVDNFPSFTIIAQWDYRSQLQDHIEAIAKGLGVDADELQERVESSLRKVPYGPIVLLENVSYENIAFVESHRREFPELDLVKVPRRLYPSDGFAAHVVGYVGEVSEGDLDRPEWALMHPGAVVGKSGLERQYDSILRGQDGARRVVVDSLGHEVEVLDEQLPTPGKDLRLSIDYDLQSIAESGFTKDEGALVALDPRTGEVLALVSRPAFNANLFATGISREDWAGLQSDPENPLLNRAIQAQLAPGSVYKVLMATAALEAGTADENTTYYCPGSASFYGRTFNCWDHKGHGHVSVHAALVHSCDVFFYNLGKELGIDKMADYSKQFGLGSKTGIDLPNEEAGTVPSPEWKEKLYRQPWYAGETISVAIGQGALTVTPLQLAYAVGGIASGGRFVQPRLVPAKELADADGNMPMQAVREVPLKDQTVEIVTDAMWGVVNEGGTGAAARVVGLDIGGKTGSAQVASLQKSKAGGSDEDLKDNGWFVGLAPRRNPEIVVAVLYQSGLHGALAAPLARDVIKGYFDKKAGKLKPLGPQGGPISKEIRLVPAAPLRASAKSVAAPG